MKHTLNIPILLGVALGMTSGMAHASQSFATDDLALVFYASGTTPADPIGTEYYVFNLGPASGFRDNTQNNVAVKTVNNSIASSNIAADLASVFGTTWFDDGKVRMMVVSAIPAAGPATNGDPAKTIYYSIARTSLNTADKGADPNTVFPSIGSTTRTQSAGDLTSFFTGTNGGITGPPPATSGANTSGVRLTTSLSNNLGLYIPPKTPTYFHVGADPTATLGNGTTGSGVLPGTAGVVAAVDVCRILHTLTGATLTSGSSSGNAVVGTPQYIGSITLDHSGNLKVQAVGVATGYTSWASSHVGSQTPGEDFNHDGVQNGIAYFMNATGTATNPGLDASNKVTWPNGGNIPSTAYGTQFVVQTSTDLVNWTPVLSSDPNLSNLSGSVSYTLPTGSPTKFCRLVVTP